MSSYFPTVEDAKSYVASMSKILITDIEKDPTRVSRWYEPPNECEKQYGFRFTNKDGKTVRFVCTPFRGGYDVWIISPETGTAVRI